jgi:SAM-dependent methyltransferase
VTLGPTLSVADAEVFETLVIPRYLSFFGSLALDMLLPHAEVVLANLACRTGYPDSLIAERVSGGSLVGIDVSAAALNLARSKATLLTGVRASYREVDTLPTPLKGESFTHAMSIHPVCSVDERGRLLHELRRLLVPGGQALLALPLRGSFAEVNDMLREFALRQDLADLGRAIDNAASSRPTIESVAEEFESVGLTDVDVDVQRISVSFGNGREFLDDPITKLMVFPDTRAMLQVDAPMADSSLKYVHDAILKYWSEGVFELTVNVGCASGRRLN